MADRIVLIDDSVDPQSLIRHAWPAGTQLLFLYWASTATLRALRSQEDVTCHALLDIVGGLATWEEHAANLAVALCDSGPEVDGLPWRRLVEEPLYREALEVVAVYDAYALTCRLGQGNPLESVDVRLTASRKALWNALDASGHTQDASLDPPSKTPPRVSLGSRLLRRLRRLGVTGDLRGQLWNMLDQLDGDYRWRLGWNRRRSTPKFPTGGITFFSSYLNNSRNLRLVEDGLDETPQWLVTNRYARVGCAGTRGDIFDLYRFADGVPLTPLEEPPLPDLAHLTGSWNRHDLPTAAVERLLATWLRQSPTWSYWQRRGHGALANLASCWQRYLDVAQPRLIVMANQWSLEGWLTQMARQRGIPVLQVLHGILSGEYYTGRPVVSDSLLVAGDFWRQLWPEKERRSIHVLRLAGTHPKVTRKPSTSVPRVTFFSWPFDRLAFYNSHQLLDGFIHLFHGLLSAGLCELQIRCHPLENPVDIIDRWKQLHGELPSSVRLSHDGPVSEVIAETDVAVMFRSTVMLDCLSNGIPLLLPGWIDFTWRSQIRDLDGVHVANDFDDLGQTLRSWLAEAPSLDLRQQASLLSEPDDGTSLRQWVSDLAPRQEAP